MDESKIILEPAVVEVQIDSGGSDNVEIFIRNLTAEDRSFEVDFGYLTETGSFPVEYLLQYGEPGEYVAIDWIEGYTEVEVEAGERAGLLFTVNVPSGLQSGSYFPTIIVKEARDDATELSLSTELVATIQVEVAGEQAVEKQLSITDFETKQGEITSLSRKFEYGVENTSKFHVIPRGRVEISSPSGVNIPTGITFNDQFTTFLPGQARLESLDWTAPEGVGLEFGNYTAKFEVLDANTNQVLDSRELQFFVVPFEYIVIAIALLGLLVLGFIFRLVRRYQSGDLAKESPAREKLRRTHK